MNEKTDLAPMAGHNNPPLPAMISEEENFAQTVTDFLNERFGEALALTTSLLDEARALPEAIDGDATKGQYTALIKRIRDHAKTLTAYHEKEGTNYMRGKQAVDQTFFGHIDRLARRAKTNKPGAADVLLARLTTYDTEQLRLEQARRQRIADEEARKFREAEAERVRLAQEAETARLAAERARKPEHIETKKEIAEQTETAAVTAGAVAESAMEAAQVARIDTFAKPADIMRNRDETTGTLSTMATEAYAEIIPGEDDKLNKDLLWALVSLDAKEKALRSWAKMTGYKVQMDGAAIGRRPKSVVR
jgi:hypothetical protein